MKVCKKKSPPPFCANLIAGKVYYDSYKTYNSGMLLMYEKLNRKYFALGSIMS